MPPETAWHQYMIEFSDSVAAEQIAAHHLAPALNHAQDSGLLSTWWYIRKTPAWRLRYQPAAPETRVVDDLLATLASDGRITGWAPGIYEPETVAFGGPAAMQIAHTLFHDDSRHLLARAAQPEPAPALGRRETTVLLVSTLLRAAGQDWFEQGDVWAKVTDLRLATGAHELTPEHRDRLAQAVRRLMTANARAAPDLVPEPWVAAFDAAGHALADLARAGRLERGPRAVLAHHVIFHANRAGLSGADQATLAKIAVDTVFHAVPAPGRSDVSGQPTPPLRFRDMATTVSDISEPSAPASELRAKLADRLLGDTLRTPAVEKAIRAVPRHLFLPGVPLDAAYADDPVYTKHDTLGASISAASQPRIVAMMLEQLQLELGQRVLEVGAGTGYNAALIAAIVGDSGPVTTIDIDADLVDGAREHLAAAGVTNVDLVLGDGALGHPQAAPFDRIIATAGAFETPTAWLDQLTPQGRLVVPLRLAGTVSRSIAFERSTDGWHSRGSQMCTFMPLRGVGDDSRRVVDLTGDGQVTLQTHKDNDAATDPTALAGVLDTPRCEAWTGVLFAPMESFEWLYLWLACRLANPIMRMNVEPAAKQTGLVSPMFPTVAMSTTLADGSLAYLTIRPAEPADDGGKRYEIGVIGHGPTAEHLADHVAGTVSTWDAHFRAREVHFAIPDTTQAPHPQADENAGRFMLHRPRHPITVTWE